MKTLLNKSVIFFFSALIPATSVAFVYVLVGSNCDPKFGCSGTVGFIFKVSILPVAFISSASVFACLAYFPKALKRDSIPNLWLVVLGVVISCFNIGVLRLAEDVGIMATVIIIALTTVVTLSILDRIYTMWR